MASDMPRFDLADFDELLDALRTANYEFSLVGELPALAPAGRRHVLLRHDVDLDPPSALGMSEREAAKGIAATYYVPLTQHFNALSADNRRAIRELRHLGHEIGLHYDLRTYPLDPGKARARLDWECDLLSAIVDARVRTICMHRPHRGRPDPFRELPDLVHPHDPRFESAGLRYVSESCRAWRDRSLLSAFSPDPPRLLLLNLHPELWLDGSEADSFRYLSETVMGVILSRGRSFVDEELAAWRGHGVHVS